MKANILIVLSIILAFAAPAYADGVLLPAPRPDSIRPPEYFSIKYHRVQVAIRDQAAKTTIDQVFMNRSDRDLEGVYLFPVPKGATLSSFAMWMNGEKVEGEVLTADEARRTYEEIVRKLRDPGLLEYVGHDLFRARVYPIPRRGEVRIQIAYDELLRRDAGVVKYRYPLSTERFSPVPLEDVSVSVKIRSAVPLKSVYSPTHEMDIEQTRYTAECGFENTDVRPDTDFMLYYTVDEKELGAYIVPHRFPGEDGYFMLLLSPGRLDDAGAVLEKDVIFIIDKSGSMRGEKLVQAKGALDYCLEHLNPGDRFNIITFSTGVASFDRELVAVSRSSRGAAREFIDAIEARGGTNIDKALRTALADAGSGRPRLVIFLTDGLPTAGETDVGDILDNARGANTAGARIFAFGVGYDVNTHLLDRLSLDNRGTVDYVIPGESIEETVSSFFIKASNPVLSDVSVDFGDITVYDLYPETLPDLFDGSQLVLFGRYRGSGPAAIGLRGSVGDSEKTFRFESSFPRVDREHEFIPRLWASRKIAYLITEMRLHGEKRELVEEVIALSKEHGIITPYTSFLITEKGSDDDRRWIMPHANEMAPEIKEAGDGFVLQSGRQAVMFDKGIIAEQEQTVIARPELSSVKHVGRKTFYRTGDEWIDADYTEGMAVEEIPAWSDAYFQMLNEHPELGGLFSLGEHIIFVFEGRAFKIAAP